MPSGLKSIGGNGWRKRLFSYVPKTPCSCCANRQLLAVDRLSKRTPAEQNDGNERADHDLEMLLQGERDGGDGGERDGLVLGRQGADLQELVLRIRLS